MIFKFFKGDGELPEGIVKTTEELAELIEETIFRNNKSTNPKYKNLVRSRVFNLKVNSRTVIEVSDRIRVATRAKK